MAPTVRGHSLTFQPVLWGPRLTQNHIQTSDPSLQDLSAPTFCPHPLPEFPSLSALSPHQPPCCPLNKPGTVLPQGLCSFCSFAWECCSLHVCVVPTSFKFHVKCHLLREAFPFLSLFKLDGAL